VSKRDLVTNAADPEQVKRAGRKTSDRVKERAHAMRVQLSTPEGRAFVWTELSRHGIYEDCAGPIEIVARFLGRRSAGLELLAEVVRHPKLFLLMQGEAMGRDEADAAENVAAHTASATTEAPAAA
jgi:hypothetical protein